MNNHNRFGYEWSTYPQIIPLYEHQFRAWVQPLLPDDFRGLRVLDAGCGTGRNSLWPLQYGAMEVVAFDIDPRCVKIARQNLAHFPNVRVEEHSIYDTPYRNEFDLTFSIGVVHHLDDPNKAVANLIKATKPGGRLLIWVYAKEGYSAVKTSINTVRQVTCHLPPALLDIFIRPFSLIWWTYLKLARSKHPYHQLLRTAPFWHLHSILFDQLLPEVSHYWTKEEVIRLFGGLPVQIENMTWVNEGSWNVIVRKTDSM